MTELDRTEGEPAAADRRGFLAALGVLGALLASACCIIPLALVTLGISGAWIGNLTALEPYKPLTGGIAIAAIAAGVLAGLFQGQARLCRWILLRPPAIIPPDQIRALVRCRAGHARHDAELVGSVALLNPSR